MIVDGYEIPTKQVIYQAYWEKSEDGEVHQVTIPDFPEVELTGRSLFSMRKPTFERLAEAVAQRINDGEVIPEPTPYDHDSPIPADQYFPVGVNVPIWSRKPTHAGDWWGLTTKWGAGGDQRRWRPYYVTCGFFDDAFGVLERFVEDGAFGLSPIPTDVIWWTPAVLPDLPRKVD